MTTKTGQKMIGTEGFQSKSQAKRIAIQSRHDWLLKRRIAHEGYPQSEAAYGDVFEYVEILEEEFHNSETENNHLRARVTFLEKELFGGD